MFKWLENWVEEYYRKELHARRDEFFQKAYDKFKTTYSDKTDGEYIEYADALDFEAERLYPLADSSMLHAKVLRAKYFFWGIGIPTTLITILITLASPGHFWLAIAVPPIGALATWALSLKTIPVEYNQRIKGGANSVLATYIYKEKKKLGTYTRRIKLRLGLVHNTQAIPVPPKPAEIDLEEGKSQQDSAQRLSPPLTVTRTSVSPNPQNNLLWARRAEGDSEERNYVALGVGQQEPAYSSNQTIVRSPASS
jgi:hypothetical protein